MAQLPADPQVIIYTKTLDSDMYRTCHAPMLASMGMLKAIIYNTCIIYEHMQQLQVLLVEGAYLRHTPTDVRSRAATTSRCLYADHWHIRWAAGSVGDAHVFTRGVHTSVEVQPPVGKQYSRQEERQCSPVRE